jgi:hypothetical protein
VCVVVEDLERVADVEFDEAWRHVLDQLARYLDDARKPQDTDPR